MKRGQLSIFLLVGVLIVISVSLILALQPKGSAPFIEAPFPAVNGAYAACAEAVTRNALETQLTQGGYIFPAQFVLVPPLTVSVGVDSQGVHVPSLAAMEEELAQELPAELAGCGVAASQTAREHGMLFFPGDAIVNVTYTDKELIVRIDQGAEIIGGGASALMQPLLLRFPSGGATLRSDADALAWEAFQSDTIPLRAAMGLRNVTLAQIEPRVSILSLRGENDVFNLAARHEQGRQENGPTLRLPAQLTLAGQPTPIDYVHPEGRPVGFSVDLPFLEVRDGTLYADTTDVRAGAYIAHIIVIDDLGRTDEALVRVVVP